MPLVEKKGSTARRSDRPYEIVSRIPAHRIVPEQGFRLLLEGRLAALGDRGPIACRSDDPKRRPQCLIRAEFERVAIINPSDGQVLAEWRD